MSISASFVSVAQAAAGGGAGSGLRGLVSDLPTDPGSIFALLLLVAFVGLAVWAGRPRKPGAPGSTGPSS